MTLNDNSDPDIPGGAAGPGGTDGAAAPPPPPPPRPAGDGFFDSVRRIGVSRSDDRWVGGVAAGVADRFRLDPLLVRGLLILSFFVAGAGLVLYGIAWALLPERSDGRIHLQEAVRGTFDVAMVGAGVTVLLGLIWGGGFWPWWSGPAEWVSVLLWIAFWVAVVWLIVKLVRSRSQPPGPKTAPPGPPPSAPNQSEASMSSSDPFTPAPQARYVAPAAPPAGGAGADAAHVGPPAPPGRPGAPQYVAPPVPPAPRPRRVVGGGTVGAVVGLALLAGAALLVAERFLGLTMPLWPTWVGNALVIVGAGIVVAGIRGLRGGWLTALAWVGILLAATAWSLTSETDPWPWDEAQVTTTSGTVISQDTVAPRSVAAAEDGVRVRFGEADVDLTLLDLADVTPGDPVEVPIEMTAGRTVVEIPADTAVGISADVDAGNLVIDVDDQRTGTSGFTQPTDYQTDEVAELGGAVLQLDIDVRAGEIVIKEER